MYFLIAIYVFLSMYFQSCQFYVFLSMYFLRPKKPTLKTTKLPRFGPIIHIFESQTKQLLRDYEDDEIKDIRVDHIHF